MKQFSTSKSKITLIKVKVERGGLLRNCTGVEIRWWYRVKLTTRNIFWRVSFENANFSFVTCKTWYLYWTRKVKFLDVLFLLNIILNINVTKQLPDFNSFGSWAFSNETWNKKCLELDSAQCTVPQNWVYMVLWSHQLYI